MARPKKNIKRQEKLTLYYTKTEMRMIQKMANNHGMSKAVYARNRSLDNNIKPRLTPVEIDLYRKLAGMANNLNQLAHAANSGRTLTKKIIEMLQAINKIIDQLR